VSLAPESFSSRRDTIAFVVCLILSFAVRVSPPAVQDALVQGTTETVLAPFLFIEHQAALLKASRARYAQVAFLRDSLIGLSLQVRSLTEDNDRLRDALGLAERLGVPHVGAEILHQATPASDEVAILSAGRADGVVPRSPVVTAGGLLGVVREVSEHVSVAALWTHPDFRASAMTADGSVYGIAAPRAGEGPGTMLLELRGVPYRDQIPVGTAIVTSGLAGRSGVYPRGIPLGTVIGTAEEHVGWSRTYVVRPAVHPAATSHVVILGVPALDLTGAFDGSAP
jgi:rod shape-determining protein MreC